MFLNKVSNIKYGVYCHNLQRFCFNYRLIKSVTIGYVVKAIDAGPLNCVFDVKTKKKCHPKQNICEKLLSCQKITKFPAINFEIRRIQFQPTTTNANIGPATFLRFVNAQNNYTTISRKYNCISVIVLFSAP